MGTLRPRLYLIFEGRANLKDDGIKWSKMCSSLEQVDNDSDSDQTKTPAREKNRNEQS